MNGIDARFRSIQLISLPEPLRLSEGAISKAGPSKTGIRLLRILDRIISTDCDFGSGATALDLCAGTGVFSVFFSMLKLQVDAVEIDGSLVPLFEDNCSANQVAPSFLHCDLLADDFTTLLGKKYEVVVLNPPCLPSDAEPTATEILRVVLSAAPGILRPDGWLFFYRTSNMEVDELLGDFRKQGYEFNALAKIWSCVSAGEFCSRYMEFDLDLWCRRNWAFQRCGEIFIFGELYATKLPQKLYCV